MSKIVFLVQVGDVTHSINNHAVIIEADLDETTNLAKVISPPEFAQDWSSVKVPGRGKWTECEGPARILEDQEYKELVDQLT